MPQGQMSSVFLSILFYCLIIPVLWFVDYILSVFTLLFISCILIVLSWRRFNGFLLSHFYFYPWLIFYLVPSPYSAFILSFIFMLFIFISALLFAFSAVFNDFCLDSSFCWQHTVTLSAFMLFHYKMTSLRESCERASCEGCPVSSKGQLEWPEAASHSC